MKIAAIIAEYNPFHNGHKYQIKEAKEKYGIDKIIAIMSGNFTQRGIPAIYDKYTRASMALNCGIDLCIELPTVYATASAEYFAMGGVGLANALGVVDYLVFGSEESDICVLTDIARLIDNETEEMSRLIKDGVKSGLSYPKARAELLSKSGCHNYASVLDKPNNILGIEYIKALNRFSSGIMPINIKRNGSDHSSQNLDCLYPSSSAIRNAMQSGPYSLTDNSIPEVVKKCIYEYNDANILPIYLNDLSYPLHYILTYLKKDGFYDYFDINKDLSDRILNNLDYYENYEQFIDLLKAKNYTHTKLSRALLHILLGIKDADLTPIQYATVLGFQKNSSDLLGLIKKEAEIPLISKNSEYLNILGDNCNAINMFNKDILSYEIYECAQHNKSNTPVKSIFRQSPVII